MPGISTHMKLIGGFFTYFYFLTVDEELWSISYLHQGSPKICHVRSPAHWQQFEKYCFQYVFNVDYQNDFNGGGRKVFSEKGIPFNPCLSNKHCVSLPFYRIVKRSGTFRILASQAYHGVINSAYNIASAEKYDDTSWVPCAFKTSK